MFEEFGYFSRLWVGEFPREVADLPVLTATLLQCLDSFGSFHLGLEGCKAFSSHAVAEGDGVGEAMLSLPDYGLHHSLHC